MYATSHLQVDVNGEHTFIVNKEVICSYSGRICKLFGTSKCVTGNLKVIFNDFPGGGANFERITRFCYNKGRVDIDHINISDLTCAAYFMEMNKSVSGTDNLCEKIEKSLDEIRFWSWSELMVALKRYQDLLKEIGSSRVLDKLFDALISRVAFSCETSACLSTSSPDSSGFRLSTDTRSSESSKNNAFRTTWWFEDLLALDSLFVNMLVKLMVSRNIDNGIISKFLFYYQKSRFLSASLDEKVRIIEMIIEALYSLDIRCVSYKNLFGLLRVGLNMTLSNSGRSKLESMIGSLLDEASLDNLLVRSRVRTGCIYDVDLVLRLLKSFIGKDACRIPLTRLKKVAGLMDLYLAEVAPDRHLKPSKFFNLIRALPDSSRDSFDKVYHAVHLYLEVHSGISEEERLRVCCGLNYEKLSTEVVNHLTENDNIPSKSAIQALISQQRKLKNLLHDTNHVTSADSPFSSFEAVGKERKKEASNQQIVLFAKKLNFTDESGKLKSHLQGMQGRVTELEKVCRKMQMQMAKIMKSRVATQRNAKSVPRLCS